MRLSKQATSAIVSICFYAIVLSSPHAEGQTRDQGPWWPHPIWGSDDQSGASNWITPEKILEAISLVKTGEVYELSHVYERGMPLTGQRTFALFIAPGAPSGDNQLMYNDEFIATQIGQVGTQFDGLGHVGKRITMADGSTKDVYYNGVTADEMQYRYGLRRLGIENMKPFITRGILIDVAGSKGLEILPNDYTVTLSDVRKALVKQGLSEDQIKPGDALIFNYGWWKLWADPEQFHAARPSRPGIGKEVADWLIQQRVSMVGSDFATDDPSAAVHHELTLKNGIPNLEFMNLEELAADNVYEFMFVFTPLRIKGATGSPGRPLAIR
jgi:kynurenine formamidase